jgi:hypothetical protein
MPDLSTVAQRLKFNLFSGSETKKRMAANVTRMIIGDIITLHDEFKTHKGDGALFFNTSNAEASQYLTVKDIQTDMALAEEMMNKDLATFFKKLIKVIEKEKDDPIVVMLDVKGMSIHVLDKNKIDEVLEEQVINAD